VGGTADRYSLNYRPANGLLDRDLPDTRGRTSLVSYYRDFGKGPIREVNGSLAWHARDTADGRQQRRNWTAGGSVESHHQVRLGLQYTQGKYRPVGARPGSWSDTVNDDYYWSVAVDFNTRSSRLGYGVTTASGNLGGGEYDYTTVYGWVRPTTTTFVNVTSERLSSFGEFYQHILSAGWDITGRQSIVARMITAHYGKAYRVAYSLQARKNVDFFLVYDREPEQLAKLSVKAVMTFQ
jgi:hypothetical protein